MATDAELATAPTRHELAALDELGREGRWAVQGRELRLANLDKVLFPARDEEPAVTKRDLIRYHAMVAPYMLPYLEGRPVNSHRYPDGVVQPGFWQKEIPGHAPEWLTRWRNVEADPGETECYAVVDELPTLVWMANLGAVELHPWTSRLPDVHEPTWALIDVDPGSRSSCSALVLPLGRPSPCRSPGTSSMTPTCGPTAGGSRPSSPGWRRRAIRSLR